MPHPRPAFNTTLSRWPLGAALTLASWALVQGGDLSGSVKERATDLGVPRAIVMVTDATTGLIAGSGATDEQGHYSVTVPGSGRYHLRASKLGYVPAPVAVSEGTGDRAVDFALSREPWLLAQPDRKPVLDWETGAGKSYLIPALEIPTFLFLLNFYDRKASPDLMENGKRVYGTNLTTLKNHALHGPWGIDTDAFAMNQFNHPYSGTVYYGFARSAGLSYWESLLYTSGGSLLWELGGETTNPSYNDQIATGIGGSFFGEALFRMSSMVLEGDGTPPGFWRKFGATLLAPSASINRFAFGERFKPIFPSHDPALFWRLRLGDSPHTDFNDQGTRTTISRHEATADYSLVYGLPGKSGYAYDRPFDYFQFDLTSLGSRSNPVDTIQIRGLLLGTDYELGDSYKAIWGLYGGYDYISPRIFRVSSTSISVGTTFQWMPTPAFVIQGSALGGIGYAAAGSVSQVGERDYHYGVAPQGLVALRVILGDWAMLDLTGRRFFLTGMGGDDPGGREAIDRLNLGLTLRVYSRHALGIQYVASSRDARYPNRPGSHQTVGTIAIVYNLLGTTGFGVVK